MHLITEKTNYFEFVFQPYQHPIIINIKVFLKRKKNFIYNILSKMKFLEWIENNVTSYSEGRIIAGIFGLIILFVFMIIVILLIN